MNSFIISAFVGGLFRHSSFVSQLMLMVN